MDDKSPNSRLPLSSSIEPTATSAAPIGPAAHLVIVEADPCGGIYYELDRGTPRIFQFGDEFAGQRLGVIDTLRGSWILDLESNRLKAVCASVMGKPRIFFFGPLWRYWIDEEGERQKTDSPIEFMIGSRIPAHLEAKTGRLTLDINVNIQARNAFTQDTLMAFDYNATDHQIALTFDAPSGLFRRAQVLIQNRHAANASWSYGVRGFPLRWPVAGEMPEHPEAQNAKPSVQTPAPDNAQQSPPRMRLKPRESVPGADRPEAQVAADASVSARRAKLRPASVPDEPVFSSPQPDRNGPETPKKGHLTTEIQYLPIPELLERIRAETDEDQRWKMIEANLMLGREERTYPLVSRHIDIVDERTRQWPPARLRQAFGRIPGGILFGIMQHWSVNQILAVAEGNPESGKILGWLREREIDRMLSLKMDQEILTIEVARRELCLDRNADAQTVKKVWRLLLGYLNADHGRQDERAIHRRKDEIAKYLQTARNVLLRPR